MIIDITFTAMVAGVPQDEDENIRWQVLCCPGCHFTITENGYFGIREPKLTLKDNWYA